MDLIAKVLFESPFWLGLFCFAMFAGVLLWRQRMESDAARKRALPLVFVGILTLFLVQWLVVTDRERILEQLDAFVAAVVNENAGAAGEVISAAYDGDGLDRDGYVETLKDWFEVVDIRDPRFSRRDVVVDGDHAVMDLAANATVSIRKDVGATHFGVWRIEWRREANGWRITKMEPVSVDLQPVSSLQSLRGMVRDR